MTKVTIIGSSRPSEEKKKIEFKRVFEGLDEKWGNNKNIGNLNPHGWKYIELVSRNFENGLDLMFAHDGDRNDEWNTNIYLGHFNDGIV